MDLPEGHARDILVAVAVVGGILLSLYLYTGTWPPPVVIESNSMMHVNATEYEHNMGDTRAEDVSYGRWGTVDPGDLVLVKALDRIDEVETYAHDEDEHYSKPGEVVIYFNSPEHRGTPIIHRAMTYVTAVDESGDPIHASEAQTTDVAGYSVVFHPDWPTDVGCGDGGREGPGAETCRQEADCERREGVKVCAFGDGGFRLPALARSSNYEDQVYAPEHSGFITQGDNAVGNAAPDQALGGGALPDRPVPAEHIQGVARAELPWFGLIKLALTGDPASTSDVRGHPYYETFGRMTAPQDLWVMLVVGLGVVTVAPVGVDYAVLYGRRWWHERQQGEASSTPVGAGGDGPDPPDPPEPEPDPPEEAASMREADPPPAAGEDEERVEIHLEDDEPGR